MRSSSSAGSRKQPWLIRKHHQMRTISFGLLFVATCIHSLDASYGTATWCWLVAVLLIYPQLQYLRSRQLKDPVASEMTNLDIDSFLLGMFAASLAYPLWIAYSAMSGTFANSAINKGWRGVGSALLAMLAGATLWRLIFGWQFSPQTSWMTTLFCIACLTAYLLAMYQIGFGRNEQLRRVRSALRQRELELTTTNETLTESMRAVTALQGQLQEMAIRDSLTGLHNRRYMDMSLQSETKRCKREAKPLALIMFDVDYFKDFNDHYGHLAGDECLKQVAEVLKMMARRPGDMAARYGGEEFVLLLVDTDFLSATRIAEQVRTQVEALGLAHSGSPLRRVTLSAGVALMNANSSSTVDTLLRDADAAMYRAKHSGRNQIH